MFMVFCQLFKIVIRCDFFSHSKQIFTFVPNFVFSVFLEVSQNFMSFRPHKTLIRHCSHP